MTMLSVSQPLQLLVVQGDELLHKLRFRVLAITKWSGNVPISMTATRIKVGAITILALGAFLFLSLEAQKAFGDIAYQQSGNANLQGVYKNYNFFATSSPQVLGYGTSTVATGGAANQATSTNIVSWFNTNGQLDTGIFVVAGASQTTLLCGRAATSTNNGSTTCTFQVETQPNGTWLYANSLNATASTSLAVGTTALVNQLVVPSGTSTIAATLNSQSFFAVRCIVNIATDGIGYCSASARW